MKKGHEEPLTFRYDEGIIVAFIFSTVLIFVLQLVVSDPVQNVMAGIIGRGDAYIIEQYRYENPFLYKLITTGTVLGAICAWLLGFIVGGNPGPRKMVVSGVCLLKGKEGVKALQEIEFELMSQAQVERKVLNIPQPKIPTKEEKKGEQK